MLKKILEINAYDYEYTIIGTGPAGITLALALAKQRKKVLLIEGGGFKYSEKSQELYDGNVLGGPYFDLQSTRVRFFGGSSNHWGGWCRPLDQIDFDDFPIEKKDLDPYLSEACNILEIKGGFDHDKQISDNFKQVEFQFSPPVRFKVPDRGSVNPSPLGEGC